jgi:hypothetical protein
MSSVCVWRDGNGSQMLKAFAVVYYFKVLLLMLRAFARISRVVNLEAPHETKNDFNQDLAACTG